MNQLRVEALRGLMGTLSQAEFADKHDLNASYISQILSGHRAFGERAASNMEAKIGLPTGTLSRPDLQAEPKGRSGTSKTDAAAKVLEMLQKHKGLNAEAREQIVQAVEQSVAEVQRSNVITADFSRAGLVGDEIRIAHYDVQGAMGGGKVVHDYPEMFRDVTVSQQHLRELGVTYKDPSHLKLISGNGQSMAPTIQHMDPLISDVSIREFTGDGIYAFTWQGHFYIKSLQVADEDHFLMVSADEKLYPPKKIRIDDTYIQARILLVWNAKRL